MGIDGEKLSLRVYRRLLPRTTEKTWLKWNESKGSMLLSVHQTTMAQSPMNPSLQLTPVTIKCSQWQDAQYIWPGFSGLHFCHLTALFNQNVAWDFHKFMKNKKNPKYSSLSTQLQTQAFWVWRDKLDMPIFGQFLPFFSAEPLKRHQVGCAQSFSDLTRNIHLGSGLGSGCATQRHSRSGTKAIKIISKDVSVHHCIHLSLDPDCWP